MWTDLSRPFPRQTGRRSRSTLKRADVFKEKGALKVVECWGDDVPGGQVTSLPMAVKCKPDETVVFSWIIWPSREIRDAGMKALMSDPRMQPDKNPMPFDGKRMIFGGFVPIVEKWRGGDERRIQPYHRLVARQRGLGEVFSAHAWSPGS